MIPPLPHSFSTSDAPLHIVLERSGWLTRSVTLVHLLALIAAFANPLPLGVRILLALVIIANLKLTFTRLSRLQALTLKADGEWEILRASGPVSGIQEAPALITPWLVILSLRTDAGQHSFLICRDGADPESFRRLRVHLRITPPAKPQPDSFWQPRKNNPTT